MKKLLIISSLITALVATSAKAADSSLNRPYFGLDLVFVDVGHDNPSADDTDDVGFGLSLGYKMTSDKLFVAPELFYDYFNTQIVYRYGAKVNVGYYFAPKFNGFVNIGVANNGYDDTTPAPQSSYSSSANKVSLIYGLGVAYDIDNNLAARLSYDWQRYNIRYDSSATDKISTGVLKVGVTYSF